MDENYEWDSEFPGDLELLEALPLGLASPRPRLETEPQPGARPAPPRVPAGPGRFRVPPPLTVVPPAGEGTPEEGCLLGTGPAPGPEARCAALREEFLAFRRRRDATRARLPACRQPAPHPEQATLL